MVNGCWLMVVGSTKTGWLLSASLNQQLTTNNQQLNTVAGLPSRTLRFGSPTTSGEAGGEEEPMQKTWVRSRTTRWVGMLVGIVLLAGSTVPSVAQTTSGGLLGGLLGGTTSGGSTSG